MARFDVYANRRGAGSLLDVPAELIGRLHARVVVPQLPPDLRLALQVAESSARLFAATDIDDHACPCPQSPIAPACQTLARSL